MPVRTRQLRMRTKLLILFLTLTMVTVLIVVEFANRDGDEPQVTGTDTEPIFIPAPTTFAPGLYLLGALSPSVSYVVETTEGLILIDAGLEEGHTLILTQFDALGLNVQDLKLILITHGHGDHYLGAMELQRLTGAKIHAGKGDADVLRQAGPRPAVFSTFPMDNVNIHPTVVDVELLGGETITLGDASIAVVASPGHTPGSVCYLLEHNGLRVLFSGDTIMTMTGDLGTYATYLPPRYRGNVTDYLATLHKIRKLPVPDLLLPGHPETDRGVISARVTSDQWSSMLGRGLRQMEQLTARYAEDGADFLDGEPKELLSGLYYLGDYSEKAVYCFARQSSVVLCDVSGDAGFIEVLEQRLREIDLDITKVVAVAVTSVEPASVQVIESLVEDTGCRVIAGQADLEVLQSINPNMRVLLPEDAAGELGWFSIQPISIEGFKRTRMVYQINWQGKRVLVSGGIPLKPTRETARELRKASFNSRKFMQSIAQLRQKQPDLWLPGKPVHGQNANVYGSDWLDLYRELQLTFGLGL